MSLSQIREAVLFRDSVSPWWELSQFQRRQREQSKHQRCDPETHDDLRFRPSHQLKVMMNRRHFEDTFLAKLVRPDLQNHRQRLDYENAADKWQQQFLFNHDCDCSDSTAEGKRAHVTHENLSRMGVIPEKAD